MEIGFDYTRSLGPTLSEFMTALASRRILGTVVISGMLTATLLAMSGAEFAWMMHDYGLPLDQIPDTIARTVQLIVDDLQATAARSLQKNTAG